MRATDFSRFSLIGISSRNIVDHLPIKDNFINAGPKIFAARIGFVLSGLIIITFISSLNNLSLVLTGILAMFSFLEGALGYCVACQIYPFLYNFLYGEDFKGLKL